MEKTIKAIMICAMAFLVYCTNTNTSEEENINALEEETNSKSHISNEECQRLKEFCEKKGLNSNVCILVDFSEFSGNERLYIYNMDENCIVESGRVAHGIGKKGLLSKASFSNVPESWESSLGRYKTGRLRTLNIPQFKMYHALRFMVLILRIQMPIEGEL